MLYVQQFHHTRQSHLKEYERLRSAADHSFLLCSNQFIEKISRSSPTPPTRASTPNPGQRSRTLLILGRIQSLVALNNSNMTTDLSILNIKATSWNPQQSRITRENKDYMTALAKGLTRPDGKIFSNENSEIFCNRWHQNLSNGNYRPSTGKPASRNSRPPTSAPERGKAALSSLVEINRPTTAPVVIEARPRRVQTGKMKSAAPTRPHPPPPPSAPLRPPRTIDSSGNFDNLISSTFLQLTDGLKSSIYKSDNHFVHQLCSTTNENLIDQFNTSHESFLDTSARTLPNELTQDKQSLVETIESDKDEDQGTNTSPHIANLGLWQRDSKSGRIEAAANVPQRKLSREDSDEIERHTVEQEQDDLRQRQHELEQYEFDLPPSSPSLITYDYKSPFTEEYDQAIAIQAQITTNNGNNEWNLKEFYRDVQTSFEDDTNTKPVFEKCLKLARLQANTVKWEQRRRQNLALYNRLMRSNALDTSTSNLTSSFTTKTTSSDKDLKELNDLKRELRCNECKRVTCLGNCAPGQDYHLYKRIVSSIPAQSSSKQPILANSSNLREQHRCKQSCTTCSTNTNRTTADIMNANAIMTSLNTNNTNTNSTTRLRSSKTTFSFGQKSQRPTVDLRPRSMHQVTREMKLKFEQANLSPVVVVPLCENESQSMLTKRSTKKPANGLVPGKSFRSQRRDSLTLVSPQKIHS